MYFMKKKIINNEDEYLVAKLIYIFLNKLFPFFFSLSNKSENLRTFSIFYLYNSFLEKKYKNYTVDMLNLFPISY